MISADEAFHLIVVLAAGIALLFLTLICICRLNSANPTTRYTIKLSYLLMGGGAVAMLLDGDYNWPTCLFAMGVLFCFQTDRRRSRLTMEKLHLNRIKIFLK